MKDASEADLKMNCQVLAFLPLVAVAPRALLPGLCQPLPMEASDVLTHAGSTAGGMSAPGAGFAGFNRQEKAGLALQQ